MSSKKRKTGSSVYLFETFFFRSSVRQCIVYATESQTPQKKKTFFFLFFLKDLFET